MHITALGANHPLVHYTTAMRLALPPILSHTLSDKRNWHENKPDIVYGQSVLCSRTLRVQCGEKGVGREKMDQLCTERHPGVCHSRGLESVGVRG